MGPWTHGGWSESFSGDVDFGSDTVLDDYNGYRLRWFDRWLKGIHNGVDGEKPVRLFTMGGGTSCKDRNGKLAHGGDWHEADEWPLPGTQYTPYFVHADGTLSTTEPGPSEPTLYTYDPRDPVPTMGGSVSAANDIMPPGAFDQRGDQRFYGCRDTLPVSARSDVLVFQTAELEEAIEVTGPITVRLWAASSATARISPRN